MFLQNYQENRGKPGFSSKSAIGIQGCRQAQHQFSPAAAKRTIDLVLLFQAAPAISGRIPGGEFWVYTG
jgi:hypothetical protein